MLRVVVDTNVLVSGTIAGKGFSARIVDAVLGGHLLLLTSEYLLNEFQTVMLRPHIASKYRQVSERVDDIAAFLRERAVMISPDPVFPETLRDPEDAPVLARALGGSADYVITGDLDLQTLRAFRDVQIVSPRRFAESVLS